MTALRAPGLALLLGLAALACGLAGLAAGSEGWSWAWGSDGPLITAIRAPRTLGAFLAGALLGLAGALAQGLFRNPLADPYLLGAAAGAGHERGGRRQPESAGTGDDEHRDGGDERGRRVAPDQEPDEERQAGEGEHRGHEDR